MKALASSSLSMPRSGIRQIMNLALAMPDALHVEVGEPDFPTPPHIVEAAHRAALDGFTRYTANAGIPSLREALCDKLRRVNGLDVPEDRLTVTHGAVSGLMTVMHALLEPGDEVLVPDPGWPNCSMMALSLGARPVGYRLEPSSGFLPDLDAISQLVTPRTKAILINSPSNPTGAVYPVELVEGMVRLAERHDLWLISDEVYEQIIFEGEHVSPARFDPDGRVISVFSFSKTYSMTGWRVGYVLSPSAITAVINKLQEPFISCASSVSQKAAEAALLGPQECVEEMRAAYHRRRDLLVDLLKEQDLFTYKPQGAFYALVNVSGAGTDTYAFAEALLRERRVAVAPGDTFGATGSGWIRFALCASEDTIQRAFAALAEQVHQAETAAVRGR